jgi:hypothetical protein
MEDNFLKDKNIKPVADARLFSLNTTAGDHAERSEV